MKSRGFSFVFGVTVVALCCLSPWTGSNAQIFGPHVKYHAGHFPKDILVADFNNDGRKDIAVISTNAQTVEVLYQQSNGTFVSQVQLDLGTNISGIAAGDFDEDGDLDLAIAAVNLNYIYIYLNNITNFFPGQTLDNPGSPISILVMQFDNDSYEDLLVTNFTSNTVNWYNGLGDGTFDINYQHVSVPDGPTKAIWYSEWNKMVAIPSYNTDSVGVVLYNQFQNLLQRAMSRWTGGLSITGADGRVVGDTRNDIVLTCRSDSTIKVMENLYDGELRLNYSIEWPGFIPYGIATSDLDLDGDDDIASISNTYNGKLWIGIQDGTNILGSLLDSIGQYPHDIAAADMNNDTYPDLVISMTQEDSIAIFYNQLGVPACQYITGDVNNSHSFTGLDVTYSVRFFKGGPLPPYSCDCPPHGTWYVAGDVNGSCSFTGLDITYMVRFFKGGPVPIPCADCPPGGRLAP
jgi:hypothetical protein